MVSLHLCPTERLFTCGIHQQVFSWYQVVDLSTNESAAAAQRCVQRVDRERGSCIVTGFTHFFSESSRGRVPSEQYSSNATTVF